MSIKSKVFAGATALTLIGGVGAVGELSANAATPSCGNHCVDLFAQVFSTHMRPSFVLDVLRQGQKIGQPIILFRESNNDPAEDFTVSREGTVHELYQAGLASAGLNLHYSHFEAYQFEYSPNGVGSGLCMGVATTAAQGTPVTLQSCGASGRTTWVVDSYDQIHGNYVPLINGSDTNFSNPYVLNYQGNSYPTDMPRPQLTVHTLSKYSNGTVFNNQMWSADTGVLP
jgi:hypothetical protein